MDSRLFIKTFVAGAFLLAVSACDQRPSAEKVGRDIDRAVDKMAPKVEEAARTVKEKTTAAAERLSPKVEEAGKTVREKTAGAADKVDDVALAARVKTALIAEPGVKARDVKVESRDGVVALHGKAESAEQKELAAKVVGAVQGVKSVSNNLVVSGS
jgi:hyperosmotically inducible periplasmic protein